MWIWWQHQRLNHSCFHDRYSTIPDQTLSIIQSSVFSRGELVRTDVIAQLACLLITLYCVKALLLGLISPVLIPVMVRAESLAATVSCLSKLVRCRCLELIYLIVCTVFCAVWRTKAWARGCLASTCIRFLWLMISTALELRWQKFHNPPWLKSW